jgi:hypothetical protein
LKNPVLYGLTSFSLDHLNGTSLARCSSLVEQGEESENEVDRRKLTQTQLLAVNLLAEQSKRSCLQRRRSSRPKLELAEKYLSAAPIATIQISARARKLKVELVHC